MPVNKEVIELLKSTIANNPRTDEFQLDYMYKQNKIFRHINDLSPYMDLLSQLKNLKKLSLYGNRLK